MANKKRRQPQRPPMVQVSPAGVFTCEACGQDTFFRIPSLDPENIETELLKRLMAQAGVSRPSDGVIYGFPEEVRCDHCRALYTPYEHPDELTEEDR